MKNIKSLVFCVVLIVGPVLIEGCCWDCDTKCYARKHKPAKFNIKEIDMIVGVRYSAPYRYAPHSIKVSSVEYKFELKKATAFFKSFKPTFAAFAGTGQCVVDPVESNETLQSYTVVSNNTMVTDKGTFAAGEDLSSIYYLTDGGQDTPFHAYEFTLLPIFVLQQKGEHILTFNLTLNDGREFEFETAKFELLAE